MSRRADAISASAAAAAAELCMLDMPATTFGCLGSAAQTRSGTAPGRTRMDANEKEN